MKRLPIIQRRRVLIALYEVLKRHNGGAFADNRVAVGVLPLDLSGAYLEFENALEKGIGA